MAWRSRRPGIELTAGAQHFAMAKRLPRAAAVHGSSYARIFAWSSLFFIGKCADMTCLEAEGRVTTTEGSRPEVGSFAASRAAADRSGRR